MQIQYATLATCSESTGTVVVIDVLRAFSTAAYAFAAGADEIFLVSSVDEALAMRQRRPELLVMGEVGGLPVPGFDFSNSPSQISRQNLHGRRLVQRTSAGTQGIVRSRRAQALFASSFVCAAATVRSIQRLQPKQVTMVITGAPPDASLPNETSQRGDEDTACADYLSALLAGRQPDPQVYLRRVIDSPAGQKFANANQPDFPASDLELCIRLNAFDFAMQVTRQGKDWAMSHST